MKLEAYVTCGHCKGRGAVVHRHQTRALNVLAPLASWADTKWIAKRLRISATHAVNVLTELLEAGRVQRRGSRGPNGYEWRI